MKPGLALFAFSLACSVFGQSQSADVSVVPFAKLLTREASSAVERGDYQGALSLLKEAESMDSSSSDIQFLEAVCLKASMLSLWEAKAKTDLALASNRFFEYSRIDCEILKAEISLELMDWNAVLESVRVIERLGTGTSRIALLACAATWYSGNERAARALIKRSIVRFPDDPAFPKFFLRHVPDVASDPDSLDIIELIRERLDRHIISDPETVVFALSKLASKKESERYYRILRANAFTVPELSIFGIRSGLSDTRSALEDFFRKRKSFSLHELQAMYDALPSPSSRADFMKEMLGFSGTFYDDANRDGKPELLISVKTGKLESFAVDRDQDNVSEFSVICSDGVPVSMLLQSTGTATTATFGPYPWLSSAGPLKRKTYNFVFRSALWRPFELVPLFPSESSGILIPCQTRDTVFPPERFFEERASSIVIANDDGSEETVRIDGGIRMESITRVGTTITGKTFYKNGVAYAGMRDHDGDGVFEATVSYEIDEDRPWGFESSISLDNDRDGLPEYVEKIEGDHEKKWDINHDGLWDMGERDAPNGSYVRFFSSELNGTFDLEIMVAKGTMTDAFRGGKKISLVPDKNEAIVWVGKKLFDIGDDIPVGEGLILFRNKPLRFFKMNEMMYAEAAK